MKINQANLTFPQIPNQQNIVRLLSAVGLRCSSSPMGDRPNFQPAGKNIARDRHDFHPAKNDNEAATRCQFRELCKASARAPATATAWYGVRQVQRLPPMRSGKIHGDSQLRHAALGCCRRPGPPAVHRDARSPACACRGLKPAGTGNSAVNVFRSRAAA